MIRYFFLTISIYLCLQFGLIYSIGINTPEGKKADLLIKQGLDELHNGHYDKSLNTFKQIQIILPNHPAGYFLEVAVIRWIQSDYYNDKLNERLLVASKISLECCKKLLKKNKNDHWAYFFKGGTLGFRGTYYESIGKIFKGIADGINAFSALKKSIEIEPNIYDAYYGLGMFNYWKSYYAVKKGFAWLLGGDERELGIDQIKLSIEKGNYVITEAKSSLIHIYYNEELYQKTIKETKELLKQYPQYLFFYWYLAKSHYQLNELDDALINYQKIKAILDQSQLTSIFAKIKVDFFLGKLYYKKLDYDKATLFLSKVLSQSKEFKTPFRDIKKYQKESQKILNKIKKQKPND